jgi:hypothetical protein
MSEKYQTLGTENQKEKIHAPNTDNINDMAK